MKYMVSNKLIIFFGMIMFFACKHECPPGPETPVDNNSNLKVGLVGHYPFTGNAGDSSGQANHGVISGATLTADRFGIINRAYNFDGNDMINVSPAPFLSSDYSYCTWIKVTTNPTTSNNLGILSIGQPATDNSLSLLNDYYTETGWGIGSYASPTKNAFYISGTLPVIGQWYHIVGTRDNTGLKLYVNGQFHGSAPVAGPAYYGDAATQIARFGSRSNSASQYFKGVIDEIRIYNRALTAEEVIQLYELN